MKRLFGIFLMVVLLYSILLTSNFNAASSPENIQNLVRRAGYYGILTIGVGTLIVSGGIDLSLGSVVGLGAVALGLLLENRYSPLTATLLVLAGSLVIGLFHGLLVTKLRLQPFIVTLCGLFVYRGLAQLAPALSFQALAHRLASYITFGWVENPAAVLIGSSRTVGIGGRPDLKGFRDLASGRLWDVIPTRLQEALPQSWAEVPLPMMFVLMLGLAIFAAVMLHFSVYGRYLYAVGYNEQAARYAGIATDRYKILAYVFCSFCGGLGGVLLLLDLETAQPSTAGSWYELYAITGAVLGGCSLRGGQGTIVGMILGAAVLPLLRNLCIFAEIPSDLEYTVIGIALLMGTVADELLKRRAAKTL